MKKRFFASIFMAAMTLSVWAQGGTVSPYSQYGLGVLSDPSQGFNRGMNGVGLALRKGNIVNTLNPASYSAVDSLTMIFDIGMSGQITNFKEGNRSLNSKTGDFEYAVGSFRLLPKVGMAFGLLPYTNINYNYTSTQLISQSLGSSTTTYSGTGGLHQAFVGAGVQVLPQLSLGVNVAYLWGTCSRNITNSNLLKTYEATVNSYKLEFGGQWIQPVNKTDVLTLAATMSLGHRLGEDPVCRIINVNSSDTTVMKVQDGLAIPMTFGLGAAWNHDGNLILAADFSLQKWGSLDMAGFNSATQTYQLCSGIMSDRFKANVGVDYVPNSADTRNLLRRIHYRMGAGYANSYYKIGTSDGPKELSVSAGFGIPLQNRWNSRSFLNISAQWVHASAPDLIRENTFRVNLGLTFNERWFAKWKID